MCMGLYMSLLCGLFAIDAIRQLSERGMLLMAYLKRKPGEGGRNPLARRVRRT